MSVGSRAADRALRPVDRRARRGARARGAALGPALARSDRAPVRGAARRRRRRAATAPRSPRARPGCISACSSPASGPGDEVITSPYSFVASANCAIYEGATPVFADIDPRTFNLDPAAVEAAITPRTKAIVAVDIFGYPCELDELRAICERHGLALVEDACEALGAHYKGGPLGSHGHPRRGRSTRTSRSRPARAARSRRAPPTSTSCSSRCATRGDSRPRAGSSTAGSASTTASTTSRPRSGSASSRSSTGSSRRAVRSPRATTSCSPASTSRLPLADDDDHVRSWFVYVVKLPRGRRPRRRDGAARRRGHRLGALPALDPPAVLHARALRVRRGDVSGQRGRERAHDGDPVPRPPRARGPGARRRGAALGARAA